MWRWGFIGRAGELTALHAALADTGTHAAVLFGAPGVGKTRLAVELLEHAANRGWATQWVTGTRGIVDVPYAAFAHLLPQGDPAAVDPGAVQRWVLGELRRTSGGRPIALGVDDAHLLDDASAGLIHRLAASAQVFVVATVRRGERVPAAVDALCADGLARRVEVPALSRAEVGQLLGTALGGQLDTAMVHWLCDISRGDLLFLYELVLIGRSRGALAERVGVWSWVGELTCSDRLTELVEDRLAGLSRSQRQAVEVLAVGEPLPPALFGSLVGSGVMQELDRSSLVTISRPGRRHGLRLAHPLYAETLRAGLGAVRRRTIYRRLADTLCATGLRRRLDVRQVALWRWESGRPADPALLVAGARRARAMFDHWLAERLARAAIGEGGGVGARVVLAEALHCQGRHHEAWSALLDCWPSGAGDGTVAQWAKVASSVFFRGIGDLHRAEGIMSWAEQAVAPGPNRDGLLVHRAVLEFFHGRPADTLTAVRPLLVSPREEIRVAARAAAVPALAVLGHGQAALQLAEDNLPACLRLREEQPRLVGEFMVMQAVACWLVGRYRQLDELTMAEYRHAVTRRSHDLRGVWALLRGRAALAAGLAATARRRLREACALLARQDPFRLLPWAATAAALAAALLGDVADAQRALAQQRRTRLPTVQIFEWEAVLAQAWTAAARGEHSAARDLACRAADIAAAAGLRTAQLHALHDAVRLGELTVAPRVAALAGSVDSELAAVLAEHAVALAAGDAAALEGCATRFAELGTPLLAAEAAAEAAEAHHRCGRPAARLAALTRSRRWAAVCEGAQTPSLRRAGGSPVLAALTPREWEIAELAAHGLPNREIAERLMLSVRTVGNHLNHIYTKSGISGRAELEILLGAEAPAHRIANVTA